jgi:hypothetical protein
MTRHDFRKSGFGVFLRELAQKCQVIIHDFTGIFTPMGKNNRLFHGRLQELITRGCST